jgi:hypothetical protein
MSVDECTTQSILNLRLALVTTMKTRQALCSLLEYDALLPLSACGDGSVVCLLLGGWRRRTYSRRKPPAVINILNCATTPACNKM